jgi:hypothetical protein
MIIGDVENFMKKNNAEIYLLNSGSCMSSGFVLWRCFLGL